jgi:TonB family protein
MLELNPRTTIESSRVRMNSESRRPRVLFLLALLLVALAIVLVHDRQFWFGSDESTIDSETPATVAKSAPSTQPGPAAPAPAKKRTSAKHSAQPKPAESGILATNRKAVPPLNVEVVSGDTHRAVHPGSNATKVEITNPAATAPAQPPANLAAATNAAEREPMPAAAAIQPPQRSFDATYPMLAQHMNVQGSVVLQALISADGIIQELRVLSGPAILTSAAEQAVRQWRFKPYLQDGRPVETQAKITVNFTIKVADNVARVS